MFAYVLCCAAVVIVQKKTKYLEPEPSTTKKFKCSFNLTNISFLFLHTSGSIAKHVWSGDYLHCMSMKLNGVQGNKTFLILSENN